MKYRVARSAMPLVIATGIAVAGIGCSDSPDSTGNNTPAPIRPQSTSLSSATVNVSVSDAGGEAQDFSFVAALTLPPGTQCSIYPEGAASDPKRRDSSFAGPDGELRFYRPPQDWGRRLQCDCSSDGGATNSHLVDLNDNTTFNQESAEDLRPRKVGVRPPLTGDLSSVPLNDLLQRGYPPRPDPRQTPDLYAKWVTSVTTQLDVYQPVGVSLLGKKSGPYEGEFGANWTGFVQDFSGFMGALAKAGTLYEFYGIDIAVPTLTCQPAGCNSAIWAGIGGYPSFLVQQFEGQLIQSGFDMSSNIARPFIEYTPAGKIVPPLPAGDNYSPGDQFTIWGWAAGGPDCSSNNNGKAACFQFIDHTKGWTWNSFNIPQNGGFWWPTTAEYIVEWEAFQNTQFSTVTMTGAAWDSNGNIHADPGNPNVFGGDPYIYVYQNGATLPVNIAYWQDLTINSPQDPMYFQWLSGQ